MPQTRPRILSVLPSFIPSTMITVVKPLVGLHRAGRISARILLEPQTTRADVDWAEAIVFCRNAEPRYAPVLAAAQARGLPILYDMDDDLLALPPHCDRLSQLREESRQAMIERYLRAAAMVRVYSKPLAERLTAFNSNVVQCFAPVDLSLTNPPLPEGEGRGKGSRGAEAAASKFEFPSPRPSPGGRGGPVRLVYATSRTDDRLCRIFLPALERILERYADRVEAHFWGYCPPHWASRPHVRRHGLICGYDRFLRRFARAGFDIGLAPLPDDPFYQAKTNNKFREYGACGVAGVYSNNDVYAACVEHEVTGLLVPNDADGWHDAIVRLIEDEPLRLKIRQNARCHVEEHYAQDRFESLFLEQMVEVLGRPRLIVRAESGTAGRDSPTAAMPGFWRRLGSRTYRLLGALRRLSPGQAWTALRWFVNDRCLAVWLRWQLRNR